MHIPTSRYKHWHESCRQSGDSLLIGLFFVYFFQNAVRLFEDDLKFFEQLHLFFRVFRIAHLFRDGEKFILQFGKCLVRHTAIIHAKEERQTSGRKSETTSEVRTKGK
jgi:hypothetical protein